MTRARLPGRAAGFAAAVSMVSATAAGCGFGSEEGAATPTAGSTTAERGVVATVVDGDTIDVMGVGRIRVIGIDTPERGACGFESATAAMSALVLGQEVDLVAGAADDADRYGRLLRYVDVGRLDAGLRLIQDGWAIARYDSRDGYGRHPRQDQYVAADVAAPDRGCYPDHDPEAR